MARKGQLTIRVNQLIRPNASSAAALKEALASSGLKPDEGDEWLRIGGIKLGVDGGFEGGWMTQPYEKPFDENGTYAGLNTMALAVLSK